ncbi:choline/ethanolamine kinase isoform X2 [Zeugodacus cucurbitae]|uniref:choline/ethanolamine kinase isoform X2 n=1 Tax=Zeugodacus cucurbitae TaxID=28588 RepID=UPI0023D937A2|nr:choline/ethanolamine kinase isoform X2 [Zeugodacus cucurbitae]
MSNLQTASLQEIRELATRLCRDYLTGRWKTISPADIVVKKINGGLSNFLYYVSLPTTDNNSQFIQQHSTAPQGSEDYLQLNGDCSELINNDCIHNNNNEDQLPLVTRRQSNSEPNEVLLRIYGEVHGEEDDALGGIITESVVFALLSERNFGPKLYGIFPGGRLEQYLNARALLTRELAVPKISEKIAEKMAEIHTLDIPMSKEPEWLWNCMERWLKTSNSILTRTDWGDKTPLVDMVRSFDFRKEKAWLQSVINEGNYNVVFCHNDMQEGNILYSNSNNSDKTSGASICLDNAEDVLQTQYTQIRNDEEPDLQIIDFEYCAYNYRAFDLANHFIEWTFDYSNPAAPYYYHHKQHYPSLEQRQRFYSAYLRKFHEDLPGYTPTAQELSDMDAEVRVFSMFSHLFWSVWSVVMTLATIEFGYWEYGVARIREYQQLKELYERESAKKS